MNFLYVVIMLFNVFLLEIKGSEFEQENNSQEISPEQQNSENTKYATAEISPEPLSSITPPPEELDNQKKELIPNLLVPKKPGSELIVPLVSEHPQFAEITDVVKEPQKEEQISAEESIMLAQPEIPAEVYESSEENIIPDELEAQVGIDTTSQENPRGNWVFKKMWYERAQEAYQKIKNLIDTIMDKRVEFFTRRSTLDKELFDIFYLEIGMGMGEFTTLIDDLTQEMEQERVPEEIAQEKQNILDTLTAEKTSINQVKSHIETLKQIDHALEQALSTVIEIINSVRKHDHDAWNYFKEIGELLSEKKARELFYKIDVALQNVKQMNNYLDQAFATYFENLEHRAHNSVAQIKEDLQHFKDKGIDFKQSIENLKKEEVKVVEQKQQEEDEEEMRPKKPVSWWQWIISPFVSIINTIKSFF